MLNQISSDTAVHLEKLRKLSVASFFGADEWRTLVDGVGVLAPVRDRLLGNLRVSARTVLRRGDDVRPGGSRLGGVPDLPAGATWPVGPDGRALWFLGQFDLSSTRGAVGGLPGDGLLAVFHGNPDGDEPAAEVRWTPAETPTTALAAPAELVDLAEESRHTGYGRYGLFDPVPVGLETELVLPHAFDVVEPGTGFDDPALVALLGFTAITALRPGEARLGGWPEWGQDPVFAPGERLLLQVRCAHPAEDPVGVCVGAGSFFVIADADTKKEAQTVVRGYFEG